MGRITEEKLDALIEMMRFHNTSYFCKWCNRHLPRTDGTYFHDEVYHPENYMPDDGSLHMVNGEVKRG